MKILVVVAHPDDEIIGCGGTIARHIKAGDSVYVCIIAEGCSARYADENMQLYNIQKLEEEKKKRTEGAKKAAKILGIKNVYLHDLPNQRLDTVPILTINKIIEKHVNKIKPDIVYTHTFHDTNKDHRIVYESTYIASRRVKQLRTFETIYSTTDDFKPNLFIDIYDVYDLKQKALKCYAGEIQIHSNVRTYQGIRAMSMARAANINMKKVEAFEIIRAIE